MDSSSSIDGLYRKVIVAVKASNSIPTQEDEYHYHRNANPTFQTQLDDCSTNICEIISTIANHCNISHENDQEIFEGTVPINWITDCIDHLLEETENELCEISDGKKSIANAPTQLKNGAFDFKQTNEKSIYSKFKSSEHISKPQLNFKETIDNSFAPFVSKLRQKFHASHVTKSDSTESEIYHPYSNEITSLSYQKWQLINESDDEYPMIALEDAIYTYIDTTEKLSAMIDILNDSKALAIDLEHHDYRSYLGITCLMQISTKTHDFLVDTLVLRSELSVLNQIFCDPKKLKVLHGSDADILWLQRDFGLYIVNMFDTGQASRVLSLQRYSLAFILTKYCNIIADKQYQLADWRQRPLSDEMIQYARQDTRYLLFIYVQMKRELLHQTQERARDLLHETYQRSNQICLQVYEKPKVTEASVKALKSKLRASSRLTDMSPLQHCVFRTLYFWRDEMAREFDESPTYVLNNQLLIKLTTMIPVKVNDLYRICQPLPTFLRQNCVPVIKLIAQTKDNFTNTPNSQSSPAPEIETKSLDKRQTFSPLERFTHWKIGKRKITALHTNDTQILKNLLFQTPNKSIDPILQEIDHSIAKIPFYTQAIDSSVSVKPEKVQETMESKIEVAPLETFASISKMRLSKKGKKAVIAKNVITKGEITQEKASIVSLPSKEINYDLKKEVQRQQERKECVSKGYNPFIMTKKGAVKGNVGGKVTAKVSGKAELKKLMHKPRNSTFGV